MESSVMQVSVRFATFLFLFFLASITVFSDAQTINTKYGVVTINNTMPYSDFYINGKLIKKFQWLTAVKHIFNTKRSEYILFVTESGQACPHVYRIADIKQNDIIISRSFGTCGMMKSYSLIGRILKIRVYRSDGNGFTTYYYHGGNYIAKTTNKSQNYKTIEISGNFPKGLITINGEVVKENGGLYFYFGKKIKIESDDGDFFTDKIIIYSHNHPKINSYGMYVMRIEVPMAGPMITEIHKY